MSDPRSIAPVSGGDQVGRGPADPGSQASPGTPSGFRPEGFDPSREGAYDPVVIFNTRYQRYWRAPCCGMTSQHHEAHVYTRKEARGHIHFVTDVLELREPWSPAPGGEARSAETGTGSVYEHPMPEGQAPDNTSDLSSLRAEIKTLRTALAESERKRAEEVIESARLRGIISSARQAATAPWSGYSSYRVEVDSEQLCNLQSCTEIIRGAILTPTQETPNAEG